MQYYIYVLLQFVNRAEFWHTFWLWHKWFMFRITKDKEHCFTIYHYGLFTCRIVRIRCHSQNWIEI